MNSLFHILYSKQPPGCDMEWFINGIQPGCQESHLYCRHLLAKILIFNKNVQIYVANFEFPLCHCMVVLWLSFEVNDLSVKIIGRNLVKLALI